MLSIKTLFPLIFLPLSTLAQSVLSPVPCTLICIERSLFTTKCEGAQNGLTDPSALPCLCEDKVFLRETINCILNSGECRNAKDKQDSFIYAAGLCKSNGIELPGDTPADLPAAFGVSYTMTDNTLATKPTVATTFPIETSSTIEISTITKTITTVTAVPTSVTCEPSFVENATYIVVVSKNSTSTYTFSPTSTRRNCGNSTMTVPYITTRKSTMTTTRKVPVTRSSSAETAPISTTTDASGAQSTITHSGFMLAFLGLVMWLV